MGAAAYADRPSLVELAAAVVTGAGHVVTELVSDGMTGAASELSRPQHIYNLAAAVLWGGYLLWRGLKTRGALAAWGLRREGFGAALRSGLCLAAVAVIPLFAYGAWQQRLPLPVTFWLVVAIYPVWGLAQQFVLQGLVTKNLRTLVPRRWPRALTVAALFSLAHFPNFQLMGLTAVAGLAFTLVYEKHRNTWAVGIVHGILGALAYYLVLGEDPGATLLGLLGA